MRLDSLARTSLIGFYCLSVVGTLIACVTSTSVRAETTPTPSPTSPQVALDIGITPSRQTVGRQEQLDVFMIVTNKSAVDVRNLTVALFNSDFATLRLPSFPTLLPGFNSVNATASIEANPSAQFKQQQVLFALTYNWISQGQWVTAIQGSAVSIQVVRPFDEEAKGLLGGGAALLYLLLPVIPLVLGYQLMDRSLSGKFQFPTFGADYVVPAFLVAVLINLILLLAFKQLSVDYAEPSTMVAIILGSFLAGLGFAAARRYEDVRLVISWRYDDHDESLTYLKKALLRPDAPSAYETATGTDSEGATWSGVLLAQPAAGPALGATFQVSTPPPGNANAPRASHAEVDQVFTDGSIRPGRAPRRELVKLLEEHKLVPNRAVGITHDGIAKDTNVVTSLKELHITGRTATQLVRYT